MLPTTYDRWLEHTAEQRRTLIEHPLYAQLQAPRALAAFALHHVWTVYDGHVLLGQLRKAHAACEPIWRPPKHPEAAHAVNALVLDTETGDLPDGGHDSHLGMYRRALFEMGQNTGPVDTFLAALDQRYSLVDAADMAMAPASARRFISTTASLLASLPAVAAAYGVNLLVSPHVALQLAGPAEGHPMLAYVYDRQARLVAAVDAVRLILDATCRTHQDWHLAEIGAQRAANAWHRLWSDTLQAIVMSRGDD